MANIFNLKMSLIVLSLTAMAMILGTAWSATTAAPSIQIPSGATSIISEIIQFIEGLFGSITKFIPSLSTNTATTSPLPAIFYIVSGYDSGSINLTGYQHSNPITVTITKKDNSTSDQSFYIKLASNSNDIIFTDVHNNSMSSCGPYLINVLNQSNGEICQFELYALPAPQGGNYTVYTASATAYYNSSVEDNLVPGSGSNPFTWKVIVTNHNSK